MPNKTPWVILLFVFFLSSCDSKQVFDEYRSVPNSWNKDSVMSFKVNPPDSIKPYNLFVNVRNTNSYKFSNLFLIVEMVYPHGKTTTDTLEYQMAKPNGELLGEGFTDIKENKLWYKGYEKPFVFEEKGEYNINIQHAMRNNGAVNGVDNLEGITDVGFRIESIN
ncbi:gliding motility lipoprotein GldH [Subsaxibacter sp. CAU 1640]|uniref:gliding motility lipoprotein GldH n=1 Tax=Subsaxibacter sp. CAU 1640 TaxID=2933271 RepID=UPI002004C557|nr:gliding motility lipoprotein GldH [Subsaxibacter sp. CAU 1640]MCK7589579.1 gliding motility lipoprotein GldH [Subsaxibacter sp. CAU 1640]